MTAENNQYKITLKKLEDSLLARLSAAEGNFLGDVELVENLENTKTTAMGIEVKVQEAKVNSIKIDEAREFYRPAAARASLIYFIMNDLYKIHPMYQFSLKAFKVVFSKWPRVTTFFALVTFFSVVIPVFSQFGQDFDDIWSLVTIYFTLVTNFFYVLTKSNKINRIIR